MAIDNQILTQTWEDQPKANIEDGLKTLLTAILAALEEPAAAGSVGIAALTQQLRDMINNAVPNTRTVNGKALSSNVTLGASDVGAMPATETVVKHINVNGQEAENNNGTVSITVEGGGEATPPDTEMSASSTNAVQNRVIKQYVDTGLAGKANDNAVVKSISVNGGNAQTPQNGNVNIQVQGAAGITPHIGSNGHWWIGDENDSENDTGVNAQGPAGTSYTSADLTIGNALNGQGDVLGMQCAMQMKANIDSLFTSLSRLYSKLGNMAFWDAADKAAAAPTALDWQVPQVTVTLDKTGLSANAMITNASDQEITGTSISVDQGSGLTLKIKPRADYAITAASATIGGVSQTLTESGGIYTLAIASVTSAITIVFSVTAAATIPITYGTLTNCSVPSGTTNPTGVLSGQSANIVIEVDSGYELTSNGITISGATVGTITHSGNVYNIPITHDGTSQSISFSAAASVLPMRLLRGYYIGTDSQQLTNAPIGTNNTLSVDQVVETDYILLPQGSSMQTMKITYGLSRSQEKDATQGPPASVAFFTKENGEFKLIATWGWSGITTTFRTINATSFNSSAKSAELTAALQAGTLYFRSALCLTAANGNTLVSGAGIQWNGVDIFTSANNYSVVTDPSLFDTFTK